MRNAWKVTSAKVTTILLALPVTLAGAQNPSVRPVDERALREYTGSYQWDQDSFLYLQMWSELTGTKQLMAFDGTGEVRRLYPTDPDGFFAGPAIGDSTAVESRIEFNRDGMGRIMSLSWWRDGAAPRIARRVEMEKHEDVRFSNGDIELAGTLFSPNTNAKHPTIILVHASGAQDREAMLPFARFLIRCGIAVFGYDKRGVGGSTGDWQIASFDDLAGDVVAAFEYLRTRTDVDGTQIGLLGWSQAGWIMPLAAVRATDIAFLISVSGPGVPPAETTIDQTRNELSARGMRPQVVDDIIQVMRLQYRFARTGQGWAEYAAAREQLAAQIGRPPDTFPATPGDAYWDFIRRLYFYDPTPTLRRLQAPTLAIFGELDNNIVAAKNRAGWESALRTGGNPDHTLLVLPKANHLLLEAEVGSNAEMMSLQRFVPTYFAIVQSWLAQRIRGFGTAHQVGCAGCRLTRRCI